MKIIRGDVYFAALPGAGDKAVLVLSSQPVNDALRSPIVCQVTRTDRPRTLDTHVFLAAGEAGLPDDSHALCHHLVTLDADDFRRRLGTLSAAAMVEVENALRRALDLT